MGLEIRYACLVETRRLLLLMGVVFGLVLFVQYFELPYSNLFSALFAPNKSQPGPINTFTTINLIDSNGPDAVSRTTDEKGSNNISEVKDGFDSGNNKTINSTVNDEVSGPVDEKGGAVSEVKDGLDSTNNETFNGTVNDELDPEDESSVEFSLLPSSGAAVNSSVISSRINDEGILEKPEVVKADSAVSVTDPSTTNVPATKKQSKPPTAAAVTISEMNNMLLKSHASYSAPKPRWRSPADQELLNAQSLLDNAPIVDNDPQFDVSLYRNFSVFKRSYELMERLLKIYIYAEGDRPIFHQPPLKGIYASEGWFMKQLKASKQFITKKPKRAHLFYLPFSSRALEVTLYVPDSHNRKPLINALTNYIERIRTRHNFWNRTGGSDHFLVACHDWAPSETRDTMPNCIRSICNSDIWEGFRFGKDASLPETYVRSPQNPLRQLGGKPPSKRRILAFFAGSMHGYLRPILLNQWENKDPDMKIFGRIQKARGQMSYAQYMKNSKYCICAKGFEVNSPRVVEAIFYECVPVIISDNFVPPFFEILNWESFAVFVLEKDIPNLKNILVSIPPRKYLQMQRRVRQVQQHFLWHSRPVKYDVFHMILHSVWYNRVFQAPRW